jgi:uncharacterized protein (TIGR00369 family)
MNDGPDPIDPIPGFAQLVGYHLAAWQPDYAEVAITLAPQHVNRSDAPHGGLIATLIDTASGFAGCYCAPPVRPRRVMTLSLNVSFIGQTTLGATLIAKARRTGGGQTIFFTHCDLTDDSGRLIATGEGVFKYRRGSEDPNGVPA